MHYRKILVPYDGSSAADKAFEHAIRFGAELRRSPEIVLLSVVENIILPPQIGETRSAVTNEMVSAEELRKELYLSMKSHAKTMLDRKAREASEAGARATTNVRYGYAADEIVRFAKEEGVDVLIIGNVGLRGISKLRVLGSVSRSVAEKATCPVMIVH